MVFLRFFLIYKAAVSYSCHRIRLFISLAPEVVTLHRGRPILQTQQLFSQFSPAKNLYAMLLNFLRLKGDDFEKTKQVMFVICVYLIFIWLLLLFNEHALIV